MRIACLDTSWLLAALLGEEGAEQLFEILAGYDRLLASPLLEAEVVSAFRREGVDLDLASAALQQLDWIFVGRRPTPELREATRAGYLRGADLWHLAAAMSLRGGPVMLDFLTLDRRQRAVAAQVGFRTPEPDVGRA